MAKGKYEDWLTPEGLIKLEGWARDGLTDEQIALNMGVGYSTLQTWKSKYQDIQDTLKRGKEVIDYEVENALLKRALGYTAKEKKLTKDGEVIELEKEVPGDVTAQIFWLKNRKPAEWKDKREDEEKQSEGVTIINNIPRPDRTD
ncbi:MAG: helix-turn-helix domain-containing protein [Lachnospiraceae bacterium]